MDFDDGRNPNDPFFPFDRLPIDVQYRILSLLPITTLVVCKAVSPSWRSIIRSPAFTDSYHPSRDPIFLLYFRLSPTVAARAYIPSTDSWVDFRFRRRVSILLTSGTSLLLLKEFCGGRLSVVDPFSPPRPINFLPRVPYLHRDYRILAVIQDNPSDYIIVAVSPRDGTHSQIYDSRSRRWKELAPLQDGRWKELAPLQEFNAVYLDGLLYCLSSRPNRLLRFDPVGGQWSALDVNLPMPFFGRYLLGFGGELYLTGVRREDTVVTRIGIWKLHWSEMACKEFDFMPDKYLADFGARRGLSYLTITACMGMICFSTEDPKEIVMCDLAVRRWWCPQACNMLGKRGLTIGNAIEPHINLLLK